jgi:hypothetical protein
MHATASVAHGTCDSARSASSESDAPASAQEMNRLEGVNEPGGSVARGVLVGLGIEAAMVFVAYCIWQIWQFIR